MDHVQQPVRSMASDGLLQLYKAHGNTVRHMLASQEGLQTALTWRRLFESFDRVDGKPSAADIAVSVVVSDRVCDGVLVSRLLEDSKKRKSKKR